MAIVPNQIKIKLSTKAGSAGDSQTQVNPNNSLGKYISTTEIVNATPHALFDSITGEQDANEVVDYRCVFVHNTNPTNVLLSAVVWIFNEVSGGADVALGVDPTGISSAGSSAAQAVEIANEETAPSGVAFSTPTSKGTALALGNIGPGQVKAFWVRRSAQDNGPITSDGAIIRIEGETEE